MKRLLHLIICSSIIIFSSCDASKRAAKKQPNTPQIDVFSVSSWIDSSDVFTKSFTGFALYDPEFDAYIDSVNYDMYFTPASNTKIYTCYAALKTLDDKIEALKYVVSGDSLIFWGTGDPSLLNPDLDKDASVITFLKERKEKLYYAPQNIGARFGPGWAWDDYNYGYSLERSDLPMYGNYSVWKFKKSTVKPSVQPAYFSQFAVEADKTFEDLSIARDEHQNMFRYNNPKKELTNKRVVPFTVNPKTTSGLLSNAVGKSVQLCQYYPSLNKRKGVKTVYSLSTDRVLKELMQPSDNMVAEQLLLNISYKEFKTFDADRVIKYISEKYLADSPDKLVWRDGSGLSRYNLFTPRTTVHVLNKMYDEFGKERIFSLLAAGGESGTIKNWYKGENKPYVYAKTGTLSNKHCLSGYIKTKSGKTLIFSFMHNNYITYSKPLKEEMEVVLKQIYEEF